MKTVFTTGQVAKICQVAPRTVSKWFDTGKLTGYQIPGSRDRRIPFANMVSFLRANGMPLDRLRRLGMFRVLLVGLDPVVSSRLRARLRDDEGFSVLTASTPFEAGIVADSNEPNVVVIDSAIGRKDAMEIARSLRREAVYADAMLAVLIGEDETRPEEFTSSGFTDIVQKPLDVEPLAKAIERRAE